MEQKTITLLRDLGLNTYESKLWLALASKGKATVGKLSEIANVPRSRSYDVLESLMKKGFVVMANKKPKEYAPKKLSNIIDLKKKNVMHSAEREIKFMEELKNSDIFSELDKIHKMGFNISEQENAVSFLKGKKNIKNKIEHILSNFVNQILISETNEGINKNNETFKNVKSKNRQNIKVLINHPDKRCKKTLDGYNLRSSNIQSRFYIVDNKELMIMLFEEDNFCIVINNSGFIDELTQIFKNQFEDK